MNMPSVKQTIPFLAVAVLIGFAVIRVAPFLKNSRSDSIVTLSSSGLALESIKIKTVVPEYNLELLKSQSVDLKNEIKQAVIESTRQSSSSQRLRPADIERFASAYASFVMISRTGSRHELIDYYNENMLVIPKQLKYEDEEKSDRIWLSSTAWARHANIQVGTIRVSPIAINGDKIAESGFKSGFMMRELRSGGLMRMNGPGKYSAFEVFLNCVVPSLDGKDEFSLVLILTMVNDGIENQWSVLESGFNGLPQGQFVQAPYP